MKNGKILMVVAALFFALNTQAHDEHKNHKHEHKGNCGHKETQHGDHADFQHGKHKHKKHEGHYDECAADEAAATEKK